MSYDVCSIPWSDFDATAKASFTSVNYRLKMSHVSFTCVTGNKMDKIKGTVCTMGKRGYGLLVNAVLNRGILTFNTTSCINI